jgi:16S rRNA (cytosine967-C5)-methyltransferase
VTPAARVQASIELLDLIITSARENGPAADTIIANWFKTRRYAGSKDRRAVRDHVYAAIRAYGIMPKTGRMAMVGLTKKDPLLAACFDGTPYGPAKIAREEQRVSRSPLAPWLGKLIDPAEHDALLERAPLDLRVNTLLAKRDDLLSEFEGAVVIDGIPNALRLVDNKVVENLDSWRLGLVEIQDAGSQLIAIACNAKPGQLIIDLCAGAGGKSLALAADMENQGRIIATDTNRDRIQKLPPRAERAGVSIIETHLLDPGKENEVVGAFMGLADTVLVDAPCSGSGTWRRNPEARWRLTPSRLAQTTALQMRILDLAAALVKPNGALVYAVCSLIEAEGQGQIRAFLGRHAGWSVADQGFNQGRASGDGRVLTPSHDGTDGFFVARLIRT